MTVTIRFVGGPADGRTMTIPNEMPPPLYLIPILPTITDLLAASVSPEPTRTAEYEPLRDAFGPRLADDGAYLYGHRAKPPTPEEQRSLERARREAREAGERRSAEMDGTWQEIRRERPNYPADWRDLF